MNSRRNGNMHWTHAEDIMMAEAYECGMSDKELSELLGRSDKSISVRRTKLANRKLKSYSRKAYKILNDARNERRDAYLRGETPVISGDKMPLKRRPMSAKQSGRVLAVRQAERIDAKNRPAAKPEERPIEVYSKLPMKPQEPKFDWIAYASGFASGAGLLAVLVMVVEVLS